MRQAIPCGEDVRTAKRDYTVGEIVPLGGLKNFCFIEKYWMVRPLFLMLEINNLPGNPDLSIKQNLLLDRDFIMKGVK